MRVPVLMVVTTIMGPRDVRMSMLVTVPVAASVAAVRDGMNGTMLVVMGMAMAGLGGPMEVSVSKTQRVGESVAAVAPEERQPDSRDRQAGKRADPRIETVRHHIRRGKE